MPRQVSTGRHAAGHNPHPHCHLTKRAATSIDMCATFTRLQGVSGSLVYCRCPCYRAITGKPPHLLPTNQRWMSVNLQVPVVPQVSYNTCTLWVTVCTVFTGTVTGSDFPTCGLPVPNPTAVSYILYITGLPDKTKFGPCHKSQGHLTKG
jgi:hypothetical protein